MRVIIYHNPCCSKSRAALALLEQHGVQPEVVHYLDQPPDAETLAGLARKLGVPAREMLRTGEAVWSSLGVDAATAGEETLFALMAAHPQLIQRPIVETADSARIGRPPEAVLELLPH